MLVGFVHGVMNTDNMTISGETIDYGPCAFMDVFDPATVFSSIDHGGRYAYGNQPAIAQWNLTRLAETLLPLVDADQDAAIEAVTAVLREFPLHFRRTWFAGMRAKLGLAEAADDDGELIDELLATLHSQQVDFTAFFRSLSASACGGEVDVAGLDGWTARWRSRLSAQGRDPHAVAEAMDRVNPVYIPRNHMVEDALIAATAGDMGPFDRLVEVVVRPFDERPGLEDHAGPAPEDFGDYRTFCGT
jgi:uncharacterized protein YdiU (UPF0061 family)